MNARCATVTEQSQTVVRKIPVFSVILFFVINALYVITAIRSIT